MPITIHYLDGGLGFLMKGEGVVTGREILNGLDERYSSEEMTRAYVYGMSDYTDVEHIEMTSDEVRRVALMDEEVSKLNPDLVIGIAAPQDLMYGLCRMFEAYAGNTGWEIGVFRTLDEAKESIRSALKTRGYQGKPIRFE